MQSQCPAGHLGMVTSKGRCGGEGLDGRGPWGGEGVCSKEPDGRSYSHRASIPLLEDVLEKARSVQSPSGHPPFHLPPPCRPACFSMSHLPNLRSPCGHKCHLCWEAFLDPAPSTYTSPHHPPGSVLHCWHGTRQELTNS